MKTAISALLFTILFISTTAYAADAPKLITNYGKFKTERLVQVEETPLVQNVYDLSFVAYDKAFAEEFGLVEDNITEMDEHLRFMEIRMVTEGKKTNCYYNLIIDKSVDIDFPEENFYLASKTPEMSFPWDYKKTMPSAALKQHIQKLVTSKKFEEYSRFNNRTYIANRGFKFHTTGMPFSGGGYGGASVINYIQDRPVPYHIFSTKSSCQGGLYNYPELAFWIRKKGRPTTLGPVLENYHTFLIPEFLAKQIKPYLIKD